MNRKNRYPGLSSFTVEQTPLFFGRQTESKELFHLIAVEKSVVLFSKSGIGKTSLLNAGVFPLMEQSDLVPVPIRFGNEQVSPETHFIQQFDTAWRRFMGSEAAPPARMPEGETFWELLKRRPFERDGQVWTPVLVFDQFEELFTLYPQPEQRAVFVQEIAALIMEKMPAALRDRLRRQLEQGVVSTAEIAGQEQMPPVKFIFSIRSDMLHFMDELSEQIPYILRSRYQLFGLSGERAEEAIIKPAALTLPDFASPPFGFSEDALREILSGLTKNNEVESFQLQAVCQALEDRLIAVQSNGSDPTALLPRNERNIPLITPEFYGGPEGIRHILEAFYQKRLAELPPEWQTPAQLLVEDALINENDRRRSVDVDDLLARPSVTQELLDALEKCRLVRKEPRLDSYYYEISHDTLLAPILTFKKQRLEAEQRIRAERRAAEAEQQAAEERRRTQVAQQNEQKARRSARIAILVSVIALALAALAAWNYFRAEANFSRFKQEQIQKTRLQTEQILREADAFLRADEYQMALRWYEKAGDLDPGNTVINTKIEYCRQKLGQ